MKYQKALNNPEFRRRNVVDFSSNSVAQSIASPNKRTKNSQNTEPPTMRRSLFSSTVSRTLSSATTSAYSTAFVVQQRPLVLSLQHSSLFFAHQDRSYQVHLTGRWANELGSKVELEFAKDGSVKGKFHTAVGDDHSWEPVHGNERSLEV